MNKRLHTNAEKLNKMCKKQGELNKTKEDKELTK